MPPLLELAEIAERLHMQPITLRRFLRRIHFRAIQGGNTLLFTEDDYLAILEARREVRPSRRAIPAARADVAASDASIAARLQALRAESLRKSNPKWARKNGATKTDENREQ